MRIVCLSAEAADICARLGAWEDVVAVTAFASQAGLAVRPIISGFSTADCERVAALCPDLVICFSDVQADIAAQLGMTENAVSQAFHRFRQNYQSLLREEIANTVATPGDIENELRYLIAVIRA